VFRDTQLRYGWTPFHIFVETPLWVGGRVVTALSKYSLAGRRKSWWQAAYGLKGFLVRRGRKTHGSRLPVVEIHGDRITIL